MGKFLIISVLAACFSYTPVQAMIHTQQPLYQVQYELMKSGEWPLPRIAPFPIRDILGQWEVENGNIIINIEYIGTDQFGRHKVDVKLFDRTTGLLVGNGPGMVANNVLRSYDLTYANQPFYLEMASLVPPKNSFEDRHNKRMVYVYIQSQKNTKAAGSARVKKIQEQI